MVWLVAGLIVLAIIVAGVRSRQNLTDKDRQCIHDVVQLVRQSRDVNQEAVIDTFRRHGYAQGQAKQLLRYFPPKLKPGRQPDQVMELMSGLRAAVGKLPED